MTMALVSLTLSNHPVHAHDCADAASVCFGWRPQCTCAVVGEADARMLCHMLCQLASSATMLPPVIVRLVITLFCENQQVLPGGAAPAARASAVGALLDDLAAAWRRYQHTLDCKRKAAQLSCVRCADL